MGVTGLWTVLQPCARPIKIETLNKKRLAVDASIWIYQFLKAVRDKEGNALRNSHIVGFFRRICKLLFIGIRPVFVFDGGAPALKRQTINNRKSRREGRREDAVRTAGKLLAIQMQRVAEEQEKKRREETRHPTQQPEEEIPENIVYADEILQTPQERAQNRKFRKKDQYHLPDLGMSMNEMGAANDPRVMSLEELEQYASMFNSGEDINVYDFSKIDFDGQFFQSLPAADRYNILNAARLRSRLRMGHSKEQLDAMFPDRMAFSKFQIERVRERNELTQRLMNLNGMNDDAFGAGAARRVAGERDREYVLVKNDGVEGGWALGVVTSKDEGQAHKPIDVDLPQRPADDQEEWGDEDDFEDVPIEGLNRLPKAISGSNTEQMEGREFIANELATRRRKFYNSRKRNFASRGPRKPAPVEQNPDSLFFAEDNNNNEDEKWEDVPIDDTLQSFEHPGDDVENKQLEMAIAMSMQPLEDNEMDATEDDPVGEVYRQQRVQEQNLFPGTKGSGLAIARLANQRSDKFISKGPFEGSESEDDMDLQGALAESRNSKRSTKPAQAKSIRDTRIASPAIQPVQNSYAALGFDGPLPFEKLNLGNSLLGKRKMQKLEESTAGGFEKHTGHDENAARPLPPWFDGKRDVMEELFVQRQEESREWEKAKEEDTAQFKSQEAHRLRKQETKEVIDVDASASQSLRQVLIVDTDSEDEPMEDVLVQEPNLQTDNQAESEPHEPQEPVSPSPEAYVRCKPLFKRNIPFAEVSEEEPVEWSESEPEEGRRNAAQEDLQDGEEVTRRSASSASEVFEDVLIQSEVNGAPDSHSLEASQHHHGPTTDESREILRNLSTPPRLEGPDDLLKPVKPPPDITDIEIAKEVLANESDQYSDPEDADLFASLAAEAEEHARFAQELTNNTTKRIDFDEELKQLRAQQKKDRRDADEVTQTMIQECQQLLSLFGLPYITAPMEAEAQCAELVSLGLVDGIVTDDSDTFLFGGTRVYKNMFNAAKFVECYLSQDLSNEFSLTREKMIAVAQLLGSDYTTGIPGIGPVTALEILSEFQDLQSFREWWDGVQNNTISKDQDAKHAFRRRFRRTQAAKLFLPPAFPDPRVTEAYLKPEVDSDPQPFEWGVPDLAALRTFLSSQIGWTWERTDEVLVPVIKDMNRREKEGTQANITHFFEGPVGAGAFAPRNRNGPGPSGKKKGTKAAGKRLGAALTRLAVREGARGGAEIDDSDADESFDGIIGNREAAPANCAKRRKRKATTGLAEMSIEDDLDPDEDDEADQEYETPKKQRTKKKRKGKA